MNEPQPGGDGNPDADGDPLFAALTALIQAEGQPQAAQLLDVSERTLQRTLAAGRLTGPMRDALERHRLSTERDEALARAKTLEARVEALTAELREARTDQPEPASEPDTPAAPREAPPSAPAPVKSTAPPLIGAKRQAAKPRRRWPQVVTPEPEQGEELVYGTATPLIVEWRHVRAAHLDRSRSRVERAADEVRMRELELALIGEHELTLPPETYPWDEFRRRDQLGHRAVALRDARAERRWALCWRFLRRVLTLGVRRR